MSVACLDIPMDEALLVQNIQCLTIQKKSGLPSIPSLITVIFHDSYSSSPKYIYIYMMIIHVTSCILSYSFVCVSAHVYDISIWPKRGRHVGGQTSFICWRLRAKTSLPITNKPCTSNYHFSATTTQIPNHPSTIMYQPYNVRPPSDVCWFINPSN